ncbi:CAMK/RAD53 protein kinase [Thecamonas trahens ATCC 50062]|uniref:CAMK/RAD53 protein kinase n=1 Tax=Thecamonas trahens ATCC 50062 TaxID=461836 RepID=A0A0L0D1K7_THETB|nr:CAMK/RAD53 protein kinase [Thecamonas trahens ATCC 50062]KNC46086.1 CAMK/RAD53 protein kinase [Thecamonas trahens ATCC 50062]|eukprot:XP_013763066.1 CAMK/RAD53 protein kinase [Thecamonas trahens ATCC 50062]
MGRGRHSSPGLRFTDIRVSGKHCKLERSEAPNSTTRVVFLTDLSSNGTYVNGRKIGRGRRVVLANNDEVSLVITTKGSNMADSNACVAYLYQDLSADATLGTGSLDPEVSETIGSRYALRHTLGSGAFAQVKLGYDLASGEQVAVKIIDIHKFRLNKHLRQESLMDEVKVLQAISHKGIVRIIDSFKTERYLYLVLELVTGGELFDRIIERGRLTEASSASLMVQLTDAVAYLHSVGIVHRDLKPENILFESTDDDASIKLTDFGLARILGATEVMTTLCGTPQYLAPEVIVSQASASGYDASIDVWSMGVILYIVLSGIPPFYEERKIPIYTQITQGMISFEAAVWATISPDAIDLVKALLTLDPRKRLPLRSIYTHPWIKRHVPDAGASAPPLSRKRALPKPDALEPSDDARESKKARQLDKVVVEPTTRTT